MRSLIETIAPESNQIAFRLALSLLCICCVACGQRKSESVEKKPNIVLIVADDLGYGDVGAYGATKVSTPAIDRIADEGMRFTNVYVSSSLCSPSRYSILTGEYPWRTRLKHSVLKYYDRPLIDSNQTTLASLLKRNGYYTACVGKWHLGFDWPLNDTAPAGGAALLDTWEKDVYKFVDFSKPVGNGPVDRGFDYFYGTAGSNNMQPYVYIENNRVTAAPSEEQQAFDHYINVPRAPNWNIKTVNQVLTHKAVDVIHDHFKNKDGQPLFLYFPTTAIHRPCLPTFTKGKSRAGLRGDLILELDWSVEQIVEALKENGAYDNTMLIFTSDNGPRPGDPVVWLRTYAEGDYEDWDEDYFKDFEPEYIDPNGNAIWKNGWLTYGHRAAGEFIGFKSDSWEGAFRVPMIVRWPSQVPAGAVNDNIICLSDLLATFADFTGKQLPETEGIDSYSFLPAMFDVDAAPARRSLTLVGGASGAFVEISDGWKYIEAAPPGRWPETYYPDGPSHLEPQLYHLSADRFERNNLIESNPAKVSELKSIIARVTEKGQTEGY